MADSLLPVENSVEKGVENLCKASEVLYKALYKAFEFLYKALYKASEDL